MVGGGGGGAPGEDGLHDGLQQGVCGCKVHMEIFRNHNKYKLI